MRNKRRGRSGHVAFKIDISKAYDWVDWKYLHKVLTQMGFNLHWINLLMSCVNQVRYVVSYDQDLLGLIIPKRGLRQGCPLSPYLYLLCAEGLSSLNLHSRRGDLHGLWITLEASEIHHLFFADDCYLFFRASLDDATTIASALLEYQRSTGQAINLSKSEILFSHNVPHLIRTDVCHCLNVAEVEDPRDYLGLPAFIGRNRVQAFHALKDKIWSRLQSWSKKKLSKAGKEVLLKTIA